LRSAGDAARGVTVRKCSIRVASFADYCGNWINGFDPAAPSSSAVSPFATGVPAPVDLKVGPDGSLYYLARGPGSVYKVRYTGNEAPTITQQPASETAFVGQQVNFTVAASGTAPLSYQWQRNAVDIRGATSSTYTISSVSSADNGARFRCVVSNTAGNAISDDATLTVTTNTAPVATITQPAEGTLYTAGPTITYAGTGTDAEDGPLAAAAFTWKIDFHHDTHVHPFMPDTSGATGGSFTIPTTGETSANVWYRIYLTVRDSQGLTTTVFRDVRPRTVKISIVAQPSGPQLTLDGQPITGNYTVAAVVGMQRTIAAPPSRQIRTWNYTFVSWSDGEAATHDITVPATDTTYTAVYQKTKVR
jgi:Immunoglobulin domain